MHPCQGQPHTQHQRLTTHTQWSIDYCSPSEMHCSWQWKCLCSASAKQVLCTVSYRTSQPYSNYCYALEHYFTTVSQYLDWLMFKSYFDNNTCNIFPTIVHTLSNHLLDNLINSRSIFNPNPMSIATECNPIHMYTVYKIQCNHHAHMHIVNGNLPILIVQQCWCP